MNFRKLVVTIIAGTFLTFIPFYFEAKKPLLYVGIALANPENDEFMGYASTGESVIVTSISGSFYGNFSEYRNFTYKIGEEQIEATAICAGGGNKWRAKGYGEYEAQSEATLKMVRFVCSYQGQMD
ncbi:MAG: hypothetical protein F6K40_10730 [Okeania sp. SIO3I5]|uniref:hypothetical protein n=1 Tax=Okeania sp. SIO3I5 TaxID=2607805 RepID=UPI0013BD9E8F|nr:hypothetical protein [Okeania sp. SIO3I5]NEQ36725.1 hypothetical protein [Okeania sp. SIO3I5]